MVHKYAGPQIVSFCFTVDEMQSSLALFMSMSAIVKLVSLWVISLKVAAPAEDLLRLII